MWHWGGRSLGQWRVTTVPQDLPGTYAEELSRTRLVTPRLLYAVILQLRVHLFISKGPPSSLYGQEVRFQTPPCWGRDEVPEHPSLILHLANGKPAQVPSPLQPTLMCPSRGGLRLCTHSTFQCTLLSLSGNCHPPQKQRMHPLHTAHSRCSRGIAEWTSQLADESQRPPGLPALEHCDPLPRQRG